MCTIAGLFSVLPFLVLCYWRIAPGKWRSRFLCACSIAGAALLDAPCALYLLIHAGIVYAAAVALCRARQKRKTILKLVLAWLVVNLCFFKYAGPVSAAVAGLGARFPALPRLPLPAIALPLGLSYVTFRMIHYLVEVYRETIPTGSFTEFVSYALFFPTFLAGPVERFQRFHPQAQAIGAFDISHLNDGLFRIVCGLIRKVVIADKLGAVILPVLSAPQGHSRAAVAAAVYGLAIQVYMDFSGYTDMAIGVSRLFGYRIMENFDRPYLKKNIALFWRSWHISVYSWIRDYFYFPVFGPRASKATPYLGTAVTMLVFHLWHNLSMSFLVLGAYHACGLLAWQLFQQAQRKAGRLREIMAHRYLDPLAIFATFTFVSFGTIFLIMDFNAAARVVSRLAYF